MVEVVTAEDISAWDADLRTLTDGLGWLFGRPEPRVTLGLMVRGLLADVPKKKSPPAAGICGGASTRAER